MTGPIPAAGHVIVVDMGYGDAGKGTMVDWLCSNGDYRAVVRFNGGAQAAHNVVAPDGRHHTFAQFGSGTFTPGVRTHLSRHMLVDPLALAAEAGHLARAGVADPLGGLTVDRDALLTTPYHRAANRARELSRTPAARHGSCGMGIGETARYAIDFPADAPVAGDCAAPRTLAAKLTLLRDRLAAELGPLAAPGIADTCAAYRAFAERVPLVDGWHLVRLLNAGPVVFEGAQGVLLDERHGFHPYTTWSTTTFRNAEELLARAGHAATRLGVVRTYLTRHGPGPLVTEDPTLELPDPHNGANEWQGQFRVGHFDAVALRYAAEVAGGVDQVALTHLDAARRRPLLACDGYDIDGRLVTRLPAGPALLAGRAGAALRAGRAGADLPAGDLRRQAMLTAALLRARPRYPARPVPADDWPDLAGQVLGAPVTVVSSGPTSLDKRTLAAAGARPLPYRLVAEDRR